jgi:hypothetical protein
MNDLRLIVGGDVAGSLRGQLTPSKYTPRAAAVPPTQSGPAIRALGPVLAFELGLAVGDPLELDDGIASLRDVLDGECTAAELRAVATVRPGTLVDAVLRATEELEQLRAEVLGHRTEVERLEIELASLTLDLSEVG